MPPGPRGRLWILAGGMSLALAGCLPMRAPEAGPMSLARPAVSVPERPAPEWSDSLIEPLIPETASPEERIAAPAALDALIRETIERNPALRASWAEFEAALQRIPQVTALSEPMVTATIAIAEVQTRTGPQDFILGIQQRLPWFGVLDLRGQVAHQMAEERLQRYLQEVLATTRRVQGIWWEMAYQESARTIAEEERDLLLGLRDIAATRYATGMGPQQAILKAEVELGRVEERLIAIRRRLATLASDLNALRDLPSLTPVSVPPLDAQTLPVYDLELSALLASAETSRPELAELRHRIERHERERRLARRRYYPEMMIGANWIAVGDRPDVPPAMAPPDEGEDAFNVVLGASVPLWWRSYRAAVQEAERNLTSAHERLADMENRVESEVLTAHFALGEALDFMELYATVLVPQAEQTLEATRAGFATGQLPFLDLIDAERVLLTMRLAHERARRDYALALADLERAIGAALVVESRGSTVESRSPSPGSAASSGEPPSLAEAQ